jgi:hypothetical protein
VLGFIMNKRYIYIAGISVAIVIIVLFAIKPIVVSKIESKVSNILKKEFSITEFSIGISSLHIEGNIHQPIKNGSNEHMSVGDIVVAGEHNFGDVDLSIVANLDTKALSNIAPLKDAKYKLTSTLKKDNDIIKIDGDIISNNESLAINNISYDIDKESINGNIKLYIKDIQNLPLVANIKLNSDVNSDTNISTQNGVITLQSNTYTKNETLKVQNLKYNIAKNTLNTSYALTIKNLNTTSIPHTLPLNGDLYSSGDVSMSGDIVATTSTITTKNETIKLNNLKYNLKSNEIETKYGLIVKNLANTTYKHDQNLTGKLAIIGDMRYKDELYLNAKTDSLGGVLDIAIDDKNIKISPKDIEIDKILHILKKPPIIKSATISGEIKLDSKIVKDSNLTNLNGKIDLISKNLELQGFKLDGVLEGLQETQSTTLTDVATFVLFSPLASVAISTAKKSYSILDNLDYKKKSHIEILKVDSTIKNGVASLNDVAFKTKNHLMATKGALDIANEKFVEFSVGLVDERGCATFVQEVGGTFAKPEVSAVSAGLKVVTGTITNLLSKAKDFVTQECDVYYKGEVLKQ